MNSLKMTLAGLILFGIQSASFADQNTDRIPAPSYNDKTTPAAINTLAISTDRSVPGESTHSVSQNLQNLRDSHNQVYRALEQQIKSANSNDERVLLENEMENLKKQNNQEELQLLLTNAEAKGDSRYATELRAAIESENVTAYSKSPVNQKSNLDPDARLAKSTKVSGGVK
jgi:TolA-binding protein